MVDADLKVLDTMAGGGVDTAGAAFEGDMVAPVSYTHLLVEGLGVAAAHAAGNKCLRCWKYEPSVGEDGLCPRCAQVLKQ